MATQSGYKDIYTMLNAETTEGGEGDIIDVGEVVSNLTFQISYNGTEPTSITVKIWGSLTGSTWDLVITHTYTVASLNHTFHLVNKFFRYFLAEFDAKSGGDETTAVTLKMGLAETRSLSRAQ